MLGMEPVPSSSGRNMVPVGNQAIQPAGSSSGTNMVALGVQSVEPSPSSSGHSKFFKKKHKNQVRIFVSVSCSIFLKYFKCSFGVMMFCGLVVLVCVLGLRECACFHERQ